MHEPRAGRHHPATIAVASCAADHHRTGRDRGFTLVEVVIAIVLVGILSAVVVVGVGNLTTRGTTAACTTSADAARAAATTHLGSTGSYPTTFTAMTGATPPTLTLPDGTTIDANGTIATVGTWTLVLAPGTGTQAPRFVCSTDAPTGFTLGPTGNYYRFVDTQLTWDAARTAAAAALPDGRTGYLATITSAAENTFIRSLISTGHIWIGGTDVTVEGAWRWATGPEAGNQFWNGLAANHATTPGSATNGAYTNWAVNEPNNGTAENCLQMYGANGVASGQWNDLACANATSRYVIEVTG